MKYIRQLGIILFITFLGEMLYIILPFPIPSSIYGLLLMFTALETKVISVRQVKDAAIFLIEVMPLMFVPAGVGLIRVWSTLKDFLLAFGLIIIISTVLVMVVSGRVTQLVIRQQKRREGKEKE